MGEANRPGNDCDREGVDGGGRPTRTTNKLAQHRKVDERQEQARCKALRRMVGRMAMTASDLREINPQQYFN